MMLTYQNLQIRGRDVMKKENIQVLIHMSVSFQNQRMNHVARQAKVIIVFMCTKL